jgi:hypothetical protein
MKRFQKIAAVFLLVIIILAMPFSAAEAANVTATPTNSVVLVDGTSITLTAFNIAGNNYFKLRDLAMALNGTERQFSVTWQSANNAIYLYTNTSYTAVGGELAGNGQSGDMTAVPTTSRVYLNGKSISLTAYNIGGNNYFKLRELASAVDFSVTWDEASGAVIIDTSSGYSDDSDSDDSLAGEILSNYYMNLLLVNLPGSTVNTSYTYLVYTISSGNVISVTKGADNLYDIQLTYTAANLSADMTDMEKAVGVFVSSPSDVTSALLGLSTARRPA